METEQKINKDSDHILVFEESEQVGLIDFTFEGNIS